MPKSGRPALPAAGSGIALVTAFSNLPTPTRRRIPGAFAKFSRAIQCVLALFRRPGPDGSGNKDWLRACFSEKLPPACRGNEVAVCLNDLFFFRPIGFPPASVLGLARKPFAAAGKHTLHDGVDFRPGEPSEAVAAASDQVNPSLGRYVPRLRLLACFLCIKKPVTKKGAKDVTWESLLRPDPKFLEHGPREAAHLECQVFLLVVLAPSYVQIGAAVLFQPVFWHAGGLRRTSF